MVHYTTTYKNGLTFANAILKRVLKTRYIKRAKRDETYTKAAKFAATLPAASLFDANGNLMRSKRILVGARVRSTVPGEFGGVQIKMTHSDRTHGEPSEFERLSHGGVEYFIEVYGNRSYVVIDLNAMRAANMFNAGYTVVEKSSNTGSFKYAEFSLRTLAKSGMVVSASEDIKSYFGI